MADIPEIKYAKSDSKVVKALRFANLLDDTKNILSPVKFNVWASNIGALSAMGATIFAWMGNHMQGIETVWTGSIAWLTHSHVMHLGTKKQKSTTEIELAKINNNNE